MEPKETPVVSPREGSDPNDGWGQLWGPGASLSCMENLAGSRAALPTLPEWKVGRPSAEVILSRPENVFFEKHSIF